MQSNGSHMTEPRRRNPYQPLRGGPKLRRSVVAFVDLLGYTDMVTNAVKKGQGSQFLRRMKRALDGALRWVLAPDEEDSLRQDVYAVKVFTDNIVIGHPISEDAEGELGHVVFQLGTFQLEMANRGFFVRGGVAIGDLYMDQNIVFGPALIDAYVAERDHARDPRIVLTESAVTAVRRHLAYYAHASHAPQARELFIDADGRYFINYLDTVNIAEEDQGPMLHEVDRHKRRIEQKLREHRGQPPIWSKYTWAANYHNFFCGLCGYDKRHTIDLSRYRMTPSLIT
jgi:hypothetical protein